METGNDSPPLRTTILGSFLGRGRPRNSSQSHIDIPRELSPSPPHPHTHANAQPASPNPYNMIVQGGGGPGGGAPGRSHRGRAAPSPTTNPPSATPAGLSLGHMLRRRRSAGNIPQQQQGHAGPAPMVPPTPGGRAPAPMSAAIASGLVAANGNANANSNANSNTGGGNGPSHRIRLVPHLDSRRSLRFDAISRDLRAGEPALRIGRFTDRSGLGLAAVNALSTNKIAFKSKVVSRAHAEVWIEDPGTGGGVPKFFIRDTKSSSGTFLNHVRLSAANTESRPHQIKDGDILQLGVDYQGGAEDIYKSVKIRVELGREWQAGVNAFNTTALKNLKSLAIAPSPSAPAASGGVASAGPRRKGSTGMGIPDCCICLFPVSIRQALFIAPCSHAFHYKCLRPLLETHHPGFSCPLCRTFADLEEDVEVEPEGEVRCVSCFFLLFLFVFSSLSLCFFHFCRVSFLGGFRRRVSGVSLFDFASPCEVLSQAEVSSRFVPGSDREF
ncbi:hypothetical protein B0H13DRAFT_875718 [Mycena leptocephala]|nr:hypothetical protein B0H13DRAFT_875718 [Mycena leptocephala]